MGTQPASARQPMLRAALAFAAGIGLAWRCWRPPAWWAVSALVFAAAALVLVRARPRATPLCALAALAALGALSFSARSQQFADELRRQQIEQFATGEAVTVTAMVIHDGLLRESGNYRRQTVELQTESITANGISVPIRSGLRVTIYRLEDDGSQVSRPPDMEMFRYGDRLRFPARLRIPRNFGNPGAWDYRGYLAGRGTLALASVRADRIQMLEPARGQVLERWRNAIRRRIVARVHAIWSGRQAALVDAMLIGEKSYLDRRTQTDFQRSGTYHILVVSGMNVGILSVAVFWVLRRMGFGGAIASTATVLLSIIFAFVADAGAPIVRATLMLAIALGARLLYRERALLNSIGLAALMVLAADPRSLFEASFQLTFISVLAIAAIGVPLLERTSLPYRRALRHLDSTAYDSSLAPRLAQFRLDLRLLAGRLRPFVGERIARWLLVSGGLAAISIYDIIVISAVAQLSLAMPMVIYFHRATVLALPANILAVPLTSVLMPAAATAVALSFLAPWVAAPFAQLAGWTLEVISGAVSLLGGLRVADVRVATPKAGVVVAATAAFVLCAMSVRRHRALAAAGLTGMLGVAAWLALVPPRPQLRPGVLEVTAIDVGQAESTFLATPDGRTLLVDAAGVLGPGPTEFDFGEDVISPYLWSRGISHLDAVVLTHAHADHMGGMAAVLANFRPRELWIGPNRISPALGRLMRQASAQGTAVVRRRGGEQFRFGETEISVLAPPPDWRPSPQPRNDDSLVLRIAYKDSAVLLEADAERKMERWIAAQQPKSDVLKVAHNGSKTSSSPELLNAVQPRWAMISVGFRNQFRHPHPEVLARLRAVGTGTYRTDTMGAITFFLDGDSARPAPR